MMRTYRDLNGDQMRSTFNVRITLGVIAALTLAIAVLHSLVFLSIQPASLSAEMPSAVISKYARR
jgi:hypothetical protein